MPVIVVTRLRLRDPALLDEFFTDAVAAIEQATKSEGNLGTDALADANNAWWSVTASHRQSRPAYPGAQCRALKDVASWPDPGGRCLGSQT
jgi:hypothetical protein